MQLGIDGYSITVGDEKDSLSDFLFYFDHVVYDGSLSRPLYELRCIDRRFNPKGEVINHTLRLKNGQVKALLHKGIKIRNMKLIGNKLRITKSRVAGLKEVFYIVLDKFNAIKGKGYVTDISYRDDASGYNIVGKTSIEYRGKPLIFKVDFRFFGVVSDPFDKVPIIVEYHYYSGKDEILEFNGLGLIQVVCTSPTETDYSLRGLSGIRQRVISKLSQIYSISLFNSSKDVFDKDLFSYPALFAKVFSEYAIYKLNSRILSLKRFNDFDFIVCEPLARERLLDLSKNDWSGVRLKMSEPKDDFLFIQDLITEPVTVSNVRIKTGMKIAIGHDNTMVCLILMSNDMMVFSFKIYNYIVNKKDMSTEIIRRILEIVQRNVQF